MLKYQISIEIDNIKVSGEDDYSYSFDWKAKVGTKTHKGHYDNSYEGHTQKAMKNILEKGYALEIVLNKLGEGN